MRCRMDGLLGLETSTPHSEAQRARWQQPQHQHQVICINHLSVSHHSHPPILTLSENVLYKSTTSFFPDQSVTLGLLLGIKPRARGSFGYQKVTGSELRETGSEQGSGVIVIGNDETGVSSGICVPLLQNIMLKKSRSSAKNLKNIEMSN